MKRVGWGVALLLSGMFFGQKKEFKTLQNLRDEVDVAARKFISELDIEKNFAT